jgi:hypothetical protein
MKKLFFHLLSLTVLNSFILLASFGANVTHRDYRLTLIKDPFQEVGRFPWIQTAFRGGPSLSTEKLT